MNNIIKLRDVPVDKSCKVIRLKTEGAIRRRLLDLGLIIGTEVTTIMKSPSGDPIAYLIRGAIIALRSEDAATIEVEIL